MTNASKRGIRRYSDLLTTGYIKTGVDGRKIFYPWGMLGNGYVFPSNDAYERLNDLLKIFTVVAITFVLPPTSAGNYLAATIMFVLTMAFYWSWMRFELPRLQRTQEKLTYRMSFTNFARLLPGWLVWVELILSLAFMAGGIAILITQPTQWMTGLVGILLFGTLAVMSAVALVLRRRLAREQC